MAQAFVRGWIARFGVPSTITTDRGRQFELKLWSTLMQMLGSKGIRTIAYHPIANGIIECFHRPLKAALKCHCNPSHWTESLPMILLGIRTALKEDFQCTVAKMVYGTTLRLPGEFFNPTQDTNMADPASYVTRLKNAMQELQAPPVHTTTQSNTRVRLLHTCICTTGRGPEGPYVLKRTNKYFVIEVKGKSDTVSMDRRKPAHLDSMPNSVSEPTLTTP